MNTTSDIYELQREKCEEYGAQPFPCPADLKVGISVNVKKGALPINGLRCNPIRDTCGPRTILFRE